METSNFCRRSPKWTQKFEHGLRIFLESHRMEISKFISTVQWVCLCIIPSNRLFNSFFQTPDYTNVSVNHGIGPSLKVDIILLKEWVGRIPGYLDLSERCQEHLMRRFCLRYTVIEHGLFTAQMPYHKNVWWVFRIFFFVKLKKFSGFSPIEHV